MGGDLKKAAQGMGFEVRTSPLVNRDGSVEGLGSMVYLSEAFRAPVGELLGPSAVNETQVVYKAVSKVAANPAELEAERDALRDQLRNSQARSRVEIFEDSLKQRLIREGKIKIHQDVLNRLVTSYRGS
jgi:predicted DNA-binding protein (UPF0251 family)